MSRVNCNTQAECDAAIRDKNTPVLIGNGYFRISGDVYVVARESSHVVAWGSSHVVAWESSHVVAWGSSHVEARESSHVVAWGSSHVVAWGSSHVVARESSHVVARESSHVVARESSHVVAWESSHVVAWGSSHVVARESSHVVARESSHVVASKLVAIHQHSDDAKVKGGVVIPVKAPKNPKEWCEFYGVEVKNNHAILFKGVGDDYNSPRGTCYKPGTKPKAADWDGGKAECGGGLHFSPFPLATLEFNDAAKRFVACPIKLENIVVHKNATYPNKVKAEGVSLPCYEVDRYGKRI